MFFEKCANLGGGQVQEVEKFLVVLTMVDFPHPVLLRRTSLSRARERGENDGGDFFEEGGHEDASSFLGLFAAAAVAFAKVDEGLAGLGDLEEGFEELGLAPGVAAVFEGVEVASGGAGAGAGAAPNPSPN